MSHLVGLWETARIAGHHLVKGSNMAKALIGYLDSDRRTHARLASDNTRLRSRVSELERLVLRLSEQNDRLLEARADALLTGSLDEMQPA